jgi:hypothetical protein
MSLGKWLILLHWYKLIRESEQMVTDSFEYCFPDEFGYILNTQLPGIDNTLNYVMVEAVN